MQALSYRYFCDGGPVQPYRILYSHTGGEQRSLHRAKDAPSEPVEDADLGASFIFRKYRRIHIPTQLEKAFLSTVETADSSGQVLNGLGQRRLAGPQLVCSSGTREIFIEANTSVAVLVLFAFTSLQQPLPP